MRLPLLGAAWYAALASFAAIFMMLSESGTWRAAYGRIEDSEYLRHGHPAYDAPYYAGTEFINANLPPDAKVLFVGEERGFYCRREFVTASVFDVNPINAGSEHYERWLRGLSPGARSRFESLIRDEAHLVFDENKRFSPDDRSWAQVFSLADEDRGAGR